MKKIIILLSCIALILGTFLLYSFLHNRLSKENVYKAKEYEFYEAINLLKEKKYSEAYQKVNDIKSVEDQKIIKRSSGSLMERENTDGLFSLYFLNIFLIASFHLSYILISYIILHKKSYLLKSIYA